MKFGKQLRARTSKLKSREFFFNYKKLKQWIRGHLEKRAQQVVQNVPLVLDAEAGKVTREKFVKALRPERGRVLNFFRRRLGVCNRRWRATCRLLEQALEDGDLDVDSSEVPAPPSGLVKEVMGPGATDSPKNDPNNAGGAAPAAAACDPRVPGSCREEVFSVAQQADNLAAYLSLNRMALAKICKKFNKKFPWAAHESGLGSILEHKWVREFDAALQERITNMEILRDEMRATVERFQLMPPEQEENAEDKAAIEDLVAEVDVATVTELVIDAMPVEAITRVRLELAKNGMGDPIAVPVIVARGKYEGPVLGITSALHGNELNGIPLIEAVTRELDVTELCGTVVAIPVLNPEGYIRNQRGFSDGQDLNRLFPGKANGNCGQVYSYNIMQKLIRHLTHLIDLHTASFGRVNSLYVRADMNHPVSRQMALHQAPQIIVHNTAPDGSMRSAAQAAGVASITVEIGNPQRFHETFIRAAHDGIDNILSYLRMHGAYSAPELPALPAVVCGHSYWIYTQCGGILHMQVKVNTWVEKGDIIALLKDMFGSVIQIYRAPETGIIVGASVNPVASTGDRLVHLGIASDSFNLKADDGHA